jgi:hypothetical protein
MEGRVSSVSERRDEEEEEDEEKEAELILMLRALSSVSALFEGGGCGFIEERLRFFVHTIDVSILVQEVIIAVVITIDGALLTITEHHLVDEERLLLDRLIHRCHLLLHHGHKCDEIGGCRSRRDR